MDGKIKVKSLKKAIDILECFSLEKAELGITEISNRLNLNKSNVHNIITTFEECGYIEHNPENGKYRLGLKILQLSHIVSRSMSFQSIIRKSVSALSKEIDEIVYFGIPDGESVMYMDAEFPEKAFNIRWVQGMTAPLVCTAIGKAMLAFMDNDFVNRILETPLVRFTDDTITDPDEMRIELIRTKQRGYSLDCMEHEYGIKCVGVPVFDHNGRLIGALSTTGPSLRFNDEKLKLSAELLKKKAKEMQQAI
ncbi:MAG: IclR family transcriptional regulator [Oscillospiraceae bacterium]|jgi:DNA-binding IclR family transcriptional regulator